MHAVQVTSSVREPKKGWSEPFQHFTGCHDGSVGVDCVVQMLLRSGQGSPIAHHRPQHKAAPDSQSLLRLPRTAGSTHMRMDSSHATTRWTASTSRARDDDRDGRDPQLAQAGPGEVLGCITA